MPVVYGEIAAIAILYQHTNINFLAQSFSEIWRGRKIKSGGCWSPQTPPSGQIFIWNHSACRPKCLPVCQISTSLVMSVSVIQFSLYSIIRSNIQNSCHHDVANLPLGCFNLIGSPCIVGVAFRGREWTSTTTRRLDTTRQSINQSENILTCPE